MSKERNSPGPIPNRWLYCPRKSDKIIADRFFAFKTPLSEAYTNQMPIDCVFMPQMIFGYCKMLKLRLGLWIDLTYSKRFYDRAAVDAQGAQYVKLQCRGHGQTPTIEQTQAFIEIVDNFISEKPFDIIGVHCTHGFNRTGFLIASYLVERMDCSVEAALSMFASARSPGIYKQDYINELYKRYEDEEDAPLAPPLPEWCLEFDDSEHGFSEKRKYEELAHPSNDKVKEADGEETNSEDKTRKKRRRELIVKNATFMEGVPGVVWVQDQSRLRELQQKVQDMCGWEKSGFPGCQPVSMDINNIKNLNEIPYHVSWKADGTRYMMLINGRNEIYFFDRNNSCFEVQNISFVKASNLNEHLENTLVDGEMVLDKYNGNITPRYLIYDIIKISNRDIGKKPFENRLICIKRELIDPRIKAFERGIIHRPSEPFSIRNKEFWDITQSASLLSEKFAKCLLHEPDGLIFQPSLLPYTPGVSPYVLKWKPLNMNSIDFRLKICTEEGLGIVKSKVCHLYVGGHDYPYGKMKYTKAVKDLDNKIVECAINNEGKWEFMRERTDKTLPNSFNTAESVKMSILNPITKEYLLEFIEKHRFRKSNGVPSPHNNQQQQIRPPQ